MKTLFCKILTLAFLLSSAVFIGTACNSEKEPPHVHTYEETWTTDYKYHFKKATCEHTTEVNEKAEHTFSNNVCTVCGYTDEKLGLSLSLNEDGQSYYVDGRGTNTDANLVIPSTYNNKPITKIADSVFGGCEYLISVTVGENVESIGANAFYQCANLTSVKLPDSLTSLGHGVFSNCPNLTQIVIPNSVTSIPSAAFIGCSKLTSVAFGNSVTSIGSSAFSNCVSLTDLTLPDSLESIGTDGFYKCIRLTKLVIPNNVKTIENTAFSNCANLTSVTIGEKVESLGSAFKGCIKLVEVINNSVNITVTRGEKDHLSNIDSGYHESYLGYYALKVFNSGDTYTNIFTTDSDGYLTYSDHNGRILVSYLGTQTELTLPSDIVKIRPGAFYGNTNLTSVVISENVTEIGTQAFYGCENLTSVTIGEKVASIEDSAFESCGKLTSVTFEDTAAWYVTPNKLDWINKNNGVETDVTAPDTNAGYFTSDYKRHYWYKN